MSETASVIMAAIAPDLDKFYELTNGNLEPIGLLFSELAQQPVPPNMLIELLGIPEEQLKSCMEKKEPPVASKAQLVDAVTKSIDPEDTADPYKKAFQTHVARLDNAKKVMSQIEPALTAFHKSCGGDLAKIEAFFCDLAPEPHKGKPMPPGMINALIRVPPADKTCSLKEFLACIERNMDPTDQADSFKDALAKHTA